MMDHPHETARSLNERAFERARKDRRFHEMAMSCVARAMHEHGRLDPERADEEAVRIAQAAAMQLLLLIYEGDAEIARLVHERDNYKRFAEETAFLRPPPPLFLDPDVAQLKVRREPEDPRRQSESA